MIEQSGDRAAKPARARYRRNLPHIQTPGRTYFVTFSTHQQWTLPERVRSKVLLHCLHDHGTKLQMHAAVVMPDHVHLLFTPLRDQQGGTYGLAEIMSGIKGASAHAINKLLKRRGPVWNAESFDHELRLAEDVNSTAEYISQNPVRAGLTETPEEYAWLWRDWVESGVGGDEEASSTIDGGSGEGA